MINRVVCVGRLTRDPEIKQTSSGNSLCSFSIAVENVYRTAEGEKTASFIPCIAFQQAAENMGKYVKKGSLIGVDGRINQRQYLKTDGSKVKVVEIICDSIQFLDSKNKNKTDSNTPRSTLDSPIIEEELENDASPF